MMSFLNMCILLMIFSFMMSNTPMMKLMFIILMTIMMSLYMGVIQQNHLWALIIMIVLLGGMFVIFLYISSLTPKFYFMQKKNKMKWKLMMNMLISMLVFIMSSIYINPYFIMESNSMSMMKMYSSFFHSTILMSIYLLFILLIVVMLIKENKRPIRSK